MPPNPPLPKVVPPVDAPRFVSASSGWTHLTGVLARDAARSLANARQARKGIDQLIRRGI